MSTTTTKPKPPMPKSFKLFRTFVSGAIALLLVLSILIWVASEIATVSGDAPRDGTGVGIMLGIVLALGMVRIGILVYAWEFYTDVEKEEEKNATQAVRPQRSTSSSSPTSDDMMIPLLLMTDFSDSGSSDSGGGGDGGGD